MRTSTRRGVLNFAHRTRPFLVLFPASTRMLVSFVILTCTLGVCALRFMLSGSDTKPCARPYFIIMFSCCQRASLRKKQHHRKWSVSFLCFGKCQKKKVRGGCSRSHTGNNMSLRSVTLKIVPLNFLLFGGAESHSQCRNGRRWTVAPNYF